MKFQLAKACPLVLALGLAFSAEAQITKELRDSVTSGFEGLTDTTTPEEVQTLADSLLDTDASVEEWSAFFANYFQDHQFTPYFAVFWQTTIEGVEGEDQAHAALLSGVAAAAAVGRGLSDVPGENTEEHFNTVSAALTWLSNLAANLSPDAGDEVFEVLRVTLRSVPPGLVPISGRPPAPNPQAALLGTQLALVTRDYAFLARRSPETVGTMLKLQDAGLHFWQAYGILLLDNSALSAEQLRSLDSLLAAIPRELHAIGAITVPRELGLDQSNWNLPLHSGQLVPIDPIPMDVPTSSGEFGPDLVPPPAPEFTIVAAQQVLRAIQAVQFRSRPELVVRRDAILESAGQRSEAYLRRTVDPSVYLDNPDELLPAIAYLWFVNTPATLETTLFLYDLNQHEAFDQFLLLADLLSGGGDRTLVYATTPDGAVTSTSARVARTYLTPTPLMDLSGGFDQAPFPTGAMYLTGIILDGTRWTFEIGRGGIVSGYRVGPAG